jgi:hypothetical protein
VHARALFERLRSEFGPKEVFIDLEGIQYGVDFVEILNEQLNGCQAMLALIDPQWATAADRQGRRRIDREYDYVRTEIVTALARGIRTVPVLIEGAELPDPEDLPEPLRPLTRRNALVLDFNRFDAEVTRLIVAIRRILNAPVVAASLPQGQQSPSRSDGPRHSESERLNNVVLAAAEAQAAALPIAPASPVTIAKVAANDGGRMADTAAAIPNAGTPGSPTPPENKVRRSRALVVTAWAIAVVVIVLIAIRALNPPRVEVAGVAAPEVSAPPPAQPATAASDSQTPNAAAPDQWRPGSANPNQPHVFASSAPNSWHPEPGYIWEKPEDRSDFTVKWSPGELNSDHPHVFAPNKEGVWSKGAGYVWVKPDDQNNLDVSWSPGLANPNHHHVVASSKPDVWDPDSG